MYYVTRILKRLWKRYTREKSGTVRFAFPAVLTMSAVLGLALAFSSTESSYVRIDTVPADVSAGDKVTINVYASAHVPTNAVDLKVRYPESQLKIEGIDVGESIITIWTEEPYAKDGYVYLRGGVYRRGFIGEHLIARIQARAIASGVARILASETTFLAGDGKGTVVAVTNTGSERASVHITEAGELKSSMTIGLVTDVDGDGDVDMHDIQNFLVAWRNNQSLFDFNGDGRMTFRDFAIILAHSFFK